MSSQFDQNPNFTRYESLLLRLNDLMARGDDEGDEGEKIREEMEHLFWRLSGPERARLGGLSADLYMLQDDEIFERFDGTQEELQAALQDSWQNKEWERLLALLRKGPEFLPQEAIAYLRFIAYKRLGHPDSALLFLRHAAQLDPQRASYKEMLLNQLTQMGRFDEAVALSDPLIEDATTPRHVLINAANVLSHRTEKMSEEEARSIHARVVDILERALDGVQVSLHLTPTLIAGAYGILGYSHEALGHLVDARSAYDEALSLKPDYGEAWAARGLLRLESDPVGALSDFEQATVHGTTAVSPYLHLARHYSLEGKYERSLELSRRMLRLTENPRIRAVALEWIAIAYSELGQPDDIVREAFELAVTYDPLNERIRYNFKQFQHRERSNSVTLDRKTPWQDVENYAFEEARSRQIGLATLMYAA